ncbi:DUF1330 domain-containing protein [Nocardia concava]|uniref:DUF1330 domain-containing protein n=1 Tax=Nocardia concava TaxID=257281 RepID=UPI0002E72806|nr:DUF1330 domain-containing protein [Nocardia concava]
MLAGRALVPRRLIIVEFPTIGQLRRWYVSHAYAEAFQTREKALDRRLLFEEGLTASTT